MNFGFIDGCLYIPLNRLRHTNDNSETDKTKFVELFKVVVNYIPSYLRRLEDVDLREADL